MRRRPPACWRPGSGTSRRGTCRLCRTAGRHRDVLRLFPGETRCCTSDRERAAAARRTPATRTTTAASWRCWPEKTRRVDRANGTGPFGRDFRTVPNRDFQAEYRRCPKPPGRRSRAAADGQCREGRPASFRRKWRVSRQTLFVERNPRRPGEFQFSGLQARSVEIRIKQIGERPAEISGRCDGAVVVGAGRTGDRRRRNGPSEPLEGRGARQLGRAVPGPGLRALRTDRAVGKEPAQR